jgi:pyruvate/2-oxoglutarate dehydrogenase complex dihydrolipoamide dehydrogenase (E3) component
VGLTEDDAKKKFGSSAVHVYRTNFADNDRAHAEGDTRGFAKIICTGHKQEIVGAHIVGPHAAELIHELVLAMKQRLSITALGSMIHVYPTLTQINQQAGVEAMLQSFSKYKTWLSLYLRIWR